MDYKNKDWLVRTKGRVIIIFFILYLGPYIIAKHKTFQISSDNNTTDIPNTR